MVTQTPEEDRESLGFNLSLAKPKMGKKIGRRSPAHKMTEQNESEKLTGEAKTPQRIEG